MPTVQLDLESRPESLLIVRRVLAGVADRLVFDPELLHDLTTVVSEACVNVVMHAYDGDPGPLSVGLHIVADGLEANVRDWGRGMGDLAPSEDRLHVGLAIISAIADQAEFVRALDGGTEVRMAFDGCSARRPLTPPDPDPGDDTRVELAGDAVLTLSQVELLSGVLGRLCTAVAARAHFSLERFGDLHLLVDAVAAHAEAAASGGPVTAAVAAGDRQLELAIGPLRSGSSERLRSDARCRRLGPSPSPAAVEVVAEPVAEAEIWRLALLDGTAAR